MSPPPCGLLIDAHHSILPTCFLPLRYVSFASSVGFLSVSALVVAQIHTGLVT
jgi:hypothetical protein